MYSRARPTVSRVVGSAKSSGDGTAPSIDVTWPGFVPHVTCGRSVGGVDVHLLVPDRAVVAAQLAPRRHGVVPRRPLSGRGPGRGGTRTWSRRGRPARPWRRPRSTCCTPSCGPPSRAPRIVEPRYSMTWPMPPPVPIWPMTARITSLAVTPAGSSPSTFTAIHFGRDLRERLGGEDVLDLARADAEGERAERAVGRGVAVAAHDRHAGQRAALLGPDDVDDALAGVAHREVRDAELGRVLAQHLDLAGRDRDRRSAGRCRPVGTLWSSVAIVSSGRRTVRPRQAQAVERLRAGDLVDEVQVDVEEIRLAGRRAHEVALPHLLGQASRGDVMCHLTI